MRQAAGDAAERETRLLAGDGIGPADLVRGRGEAEGTRRAARLPVQVEVEPAEGGYRARFELPRGSYATVVLGELVKGEGDLDGVGEGE
jgi:tRNA pseudouridine13 synthase